MTKEQKFYNALKEIFVGAKVEGESGYINLMRIKSRYYEKGVFPKLQEDIKKAVEPFPEFKEELFDKLYTFFQRYFSESGSIYFRYTPIHQNVYEKVYTDDKDVILFWKTHMLYYVKTDRLFKNLEVEVGGYKFFFDVSTLEHKKANEKRDVIFDFKERRKDGVLVFNVYYSERGRTTKIEDILKALRKEGVKIAEDILEKAFRVFEKQSEVDYFINKNAKEFLREQFNLWLYQYVFSGESEWTEKRIKQLQVLKDIAFKIIDFISQFEDELVKIWNKPKFVLNSNYVITLDRIAEKDKELKLIEKILKHKNFNEQVKEWKELGIVDESFKENEIIEKDLMGKRLKEKLDKLKNDGIFISDLMGKRLKEKYKHLPVDTKYFKDLEFEILGLFDDLDNSLDGWLIKSENYQALNSILPKFKEKVQTIYIDPPFNKEQDADYFYSVKYKDSSWATMLENRLRLARDLLNEKGSIFVRCDYNGNWIVRPLMNEIFGEENFRNEIILRKTAYLAKREVSNLEQETESLMNFCKNHEMVFFNRIWIQREPQWVLMQQKPNRGQTGKPIIIGNQVFHPNEGYCWARGNEVANRMYREGRLQIRGNKLYILLDKKAPGTNWTDIIGYSMNWQFQTENSEILLKRVIESTSNEGDLVMDFFLGSGTTTAVAHKLKRKWIGVEMGEHFYTVVLPRMKKVLFYDKSGISKEKDVKKKYNENKAGGFFKYYELEQYEDTLRRVKYEDSDLFDNPYQDPYNQYVFMKDLKMLEALEIDYENNKVKVDLSKLYPNIDVAETLSNLLGKWIKRITSDFVEFEGGEKIDLKNLDYKLIKPLIWW
ncbi:DNA methyltransferase [Thermodesulfobacterium hveragerdense]|uniref:DNA methyltransferase n=1 Tax=Thermodesulfobacterium hveragerdense TaxID=53424 RepID=UPI00040947A7|nr:site-specific DNA-methyltransferase [Thermodesulfobacterium hveragerdense]